ncbi:DUF6212 domain-containing protein [Sinorhizobium sp. 7-81]|uniref:DUF6212 domain-containing protein n=1 Tax=Sinorhizobium sp. 8-89 TaxID=3049089 RepID=UPI0024C2CEB7|nr:DUF6212 domain-containing protein [Sinorhizobium sp. 8-89]MDK1491807.1 DUF6212 domain-containing protein [Sinorhizobium sp. 8-89]
MSSSIRQSPAKRRLIVASDRDRANVEGSGIEHLVHFLQADTGSQSPLQNAFPLIALAFSAEGESHLREGLAAVQALGTVPEIPVQRIDASNRAESLTLVHALMEGGIGRLARFTSSITSELAILRRERESLLENYRALEDAFQARNWEPVTEVFAHDPYVDPKDEGVGQLLATGYVEQILPVSSHGVAGVALHLHSVPKDGGELVVVLGYVENGEGVAEWTVPYTQLAAGWSFFALPRACGGGARTLRLRVSTTGGEMVGLSLGYPIASERYTARSEAPHPDLDLRPLAFRVFTGLPGVRPTRMPNMIAPTALLDGHFIEDYRLAVDLLSQIVDVSVTPIVPEFQTVRFLEHEHAVVCHPLPSGISAGTIGRAVEPGTISFSASAVIDHPQGAPAAVSFLLAPANSNARSEVAELARKGAAKPSAFFSGWREVTAQKAININFQLDEPVRAPMDLMILSRAVSDSVDFSWLKVSGFRLVKQSAGASHVNE